MPQLAGDVAQKDDSVADLVVGHKITAMGRPLLLGHRGARASRAFPENTVPSFDLALQHGCDGFEFDVRRTLDGEAVICHDPVWRDRSSGSRTVAVSSARRNELAGLQSLPEVLTRYRSSAFLDIELKVIGLADPLLSSLQLSSPGPGLAITSFLPEALYEVNRADARLPLGLICETRDQLEAWRDLPILFVMAHQGLVRQELIATLASAGKQTMVWTVNDADAMRRFAEWGVAGIISDETELLVNTLGGKSSP